MPKMSCIPAPAACDAVAVAATVTGNANALSVAKVKQSSAMRMAAKEEEGKRRGPASAAAAGPGATPLSASATFEVCFVCLAGQQRYFVWNEDLRRHPPSLSRRSTTRARTSSMHPCAQVKPRQPELAATQEKEHIHSDAPRNARASWLPEIYGYILYKLR